MTYKRTYQVIRSFFPALLILIALGMAINTASAAMNGKGNQEELFAVSAAGDPVCPVGMIAYWELEESDGPYLDSYGDHDGDDTGTAPIQVAGKFGNGQEFDFATGEPPVAINPGIDIPSHADFDWGTDDSFSIEFWVKPEVDACASHSRVMVGRDDGTGIQWWIGCSGLSGQATFQLDDSANVRVTVKGVSITDGAWHHIVAIRDANADMNYLYVDNVANSMTANTYTGDFAAVVDANVNIGWIDHRTDSPNIHRFAGVVDEVAIYNKALTAGEIAYHFSGGAGGAARPYCNNAPAFTPVSDQTNTEGQTVTPLDIDATDLESDGLVFDDNGTLPDGLSIHPSTGVISGTLTFISSGIHPVVVTATDNGEPSAFNELSFTWTVDNVNGPPQVTNPGDQSDAEGDLIAPLTIVATEPDGEPMTFSQVNLPPSLSLNPTTGVISGTISYDGYKGSAYAVEITVTDGANPTTISFNWTVTETNRPPQVTSPGNKSNTEGETVSVLVNASDLDGNSLTFDVTGLPDGLDFSPVDADTIEISGTISHLAYTGAPYTVTVTATDDGTPNEDGTAVFTWTVSDDNRAPELTSPGNKANSEGQIVSLQIVATDEDSDNTLTYSADGLPAGLSINPGTGLISGTISAGAASGSPYSVTVEVEDDGDPVLSDSVTFTWTVVSGEGFEIFLPLVIRQDS
jgi:hypothetical protein